jgi:hypothetical protein
MWNIHRRISLAGIVLLAVSAVARVATRHADGKTVGATWGYEQGLRVLKGAEFANLFPQPRYYVMDHVEHPSPN